MFLQYAYIRSLLREQIERVKVWIEVRLASRSMELTDLGWVEPLERWEKDRDEWVEYVRFHPYCGTRSRLGYIKEDPWVVSWCYKCFSMWSVPRDDEDDGGGKRKEFPKPPHPIDPTDGLPPCEWHESQKVLGTFTSSSIAK